MRATVERMCEWRECGRTFTAQLAEVKRGWAHFCSQACSSANKRDLRPAQSNHRLNGIARNIYIERHGEPICMKCGNPADVHHKDGNRKNNADENHEPLCRACHTAHHNRLTPRRKKGVSFPGDSRIYREYVIECATRDMGKLMLMESRGDKRFVDMAAQ